MRLKVDFYPFAYVLRFLIYEATNDTFPFLIATRDYFCDRIVTNFK